MIIKTPNLRTLLILALFFLCSVACASPPQIGAQIWIEPGQTEAEIDRWVETLSEHDMPVARVFIMWNYVEKAPGQWDFSLYDQLFESADKYGVEIEATLTANHGPPHKNKKYWYKEQGGSIPSTIEQLNSSKDYIRKVVTRYKDEPALGSWWLMNEPGQKNTHDPLAMRRFKEWLRDKYFSIDSLNQKWLTDFENFDTIRYAQYWDQKYGFSNPASFLDWNWFWRDHLTWYMQWIANRVREYDTTHPLHVNPHGVFDILPKYDLPAWQNFLSSLGASVHPAWHFEMLERDQFAMGVSGICDIIEGAMEPKPFWVSELQGGNNIFSTPRPLCPTPKDIDQWVWTGIGSGAEKVIFWCLNKRYRGGEAGEWSMLTYQNEPTARLKESAAIARTINDHTIFFEKAEPVKPGVTLLLSPESMLILKRKDIWEDIPGISRRAHIKAVMAFYQTLLEMGMEPAIKSTRDFDWKNQEQHLAILANAVALPNDLIPKIKAFTAHNNRLIITGLTGYFDEHERNVLQDRYPLKDIVGGTIKEIQTVSDSFSIPFGNAEFQMPSHMWVSDIKNNSGSVQATFKGNIAALSHKFRESNITWIPSPVGLGAWLFGNKKLAAFLEQQTQTLRKKKIITFAGHHQDVLMKILQNRDEYVSVITNGAAEKKEVQLISANEKKPKVIFGKETHFDEKNYRLSLGDRETIVVQWK